MLCEASNVGGAQTQSVKAHVEESSPVFLSRVHLYSFQYDEKSQDGREGTISREKPGYNELRL